MKNIKILQLYKVLELKKNTGAKQYLVRSKMFKTSRPLLKGIEFVFYEFMNTIKKKKAA